MTIEQITGIIEDLALSTVQKMACTIGIIFKLAA